MDKPKNTEADSFIIKYVKNDVPWSISTMYILIIFNIILIDNTTLLIDNLVILALGLTGIATTFLIAGIYAMSTKRIRANIILKKSEYNQREMTDCEVVKVINNYIRIRKYENKEKYKEYLINKEVVKEIEVIKRVEV